MATAEVVCKNVTLFYRSKEGNKEFVSLQVAQTADVTALSNMLSRLPTIDAGSATSVAGSVTLTVV